MTIEDFGAGVASVWEGLRPSTRSLVERALTAPPPAAARGDSHYDARSEWELSRLLAALDARAAEKGAKVLSAEASRELRHVAETCAAVLHREARSAEVFAQLLERALRSRDYARVDALADAMTGRLAPSELCELARNPNPAVRAVAHEALLQLPTGALVSLLGDPIDAETARSALESQADEYESEEARLIVNVLDQADDAEDDL
jgi:MoxR-like ATPase